MREQTTGPAFTCLFVWLACHTCMETRPPEITKLDDALDMLPDQSQKKTENKKTIYGTERNAKTCPNNKWNQKTHVPAPRVSHDMEILLRPQNHDIHHLLSIWCFTAMSQQSVMSGLPKSQMWALQTCDPRVRGLAAPTFQETPWSDLQKSCIAKQRSNTTWCGAVA